MSEWSTWLLHAWVGVVLAVGVAAAADHETLEVPRLVERESIVAVTPADSTKPGSSRLAAPFVAAPVRVTAPAVGIDADLVAVGKTPDGALEVPDFGTAGWYDGSVRPGADGAAVLAGHVDSTSGPDVFFALADLQRGDEVVVRRADGSSVRFIVRLVETTAKEDLPVERIFGETPEPALRLITCGGSYDQATRSYEANITVYADPAPSPGPDTSR